VATEPEEVNVIVGDQGSVTALLYSAPRKSRAGITVILGHGAGANQMSPFMRLVASELSTRGFDVVTFNFLYSERGRRVPDPKAKLEACYRAVIAAAIEHKKLKRNRLVVGGKSMGGRIASQVAAVEDGALPDSRASAMRAFPTRASEDLAGLVFLGYPLHPPGRPEQLRDAHLKDIKAPMLFVQGSRDAFGTPEELRAVIKRLHLPATLYVIEGGDHSFKVPKNSSVPQQEVYENVMDEISRWLLGKEGCL
jgi:predicted alpha/beta-hydrolase family hydrolase